jgi:feruloyl esterase
MGSDHQGWDLYWANPKKPDEPQRADFFRYWVFHDPTWNWWNFDWNKDVDRVRARMGPMVDAVDSDLSAFKKHGGKLILFSGWQDPVVSTYDVIDYYQAVATKTGGMRSTKSFARLFLVPGMAHCAGGAGATNFASSTRDSTPLKPDPLHDMSLALQEWVEHDHAPDRLIAARYKGDEPESGVVLTRMLCPYPAVATLAGPDPAVAENYRCTAPPR